MKKYILFAFFIILISHASALQLSPAFTSLDFSPGAQKTISLSALNDQGRNLDFVIFAQGDLNDSVSFPENRFSMSSADGSKTFSINLQMPSYIEPGIHDLDIVSFEVPGQSGYSSSQSLARIEINAPYPSEYLDSNLSIYGANQNSTAQIRLEVSGKGTGNISGVSAEINIYNGLNEKVASLKTDSQDVLSGQSAVLSAPWEVSVPVGKYKAISTISYSGKTSLSEYDFDVGSSFIEIQQVQVKNFNLGGIAKFEMLVQNNFNQKISGVSLRTQISGSDGKVIGDFKSASYDIDSLKKADIVSYWDTSDVQAGEYKAKISTDNGNGIQDKEVSIIVNDNSINVTGMQARVSEASSKSFFGTTTLIIAAAILILANAAWIFISRKRLRSKA